MPTDRDRIQIRSARLMLCSLGLLTIICMIDSAAYACVQCITKMSALVHSITKVNIWLVCAVTCSSTFHVCASSQHILRYKRELEHVRKQKEAWLRTRQIPHHRQRHRHNLESQGFTKHPVYSLSYYVRILQYRQSIMILLWLN